MHEYKLLRWLTVCIGSLLTAGIVTLTVYAVTVEKNITGAIQYSIPVTTYTYEEIYQAQQEYLETSVFGNIYGQQLRKAVDRRAYTNAVTEQIELQAEMEKKKYYIPDIVLDHAHEHLTMPYELQTYIWEQSQKLGLDYFLVMGIIARESRYVADVVGYHDGIYYYGYMQLSGKYYKAMQETVGLGDIDIDVLNPYDNVLLGMHFLAYCIEVTGSEHDGLMAYGMGLQGYADAKAAGQTTCEDVEKAYKFRNLLKQNERYSTEY